MFSSMQKGELNKTPGLSKLVLTTFYLCTIPLDLTAGTGVDLIYVTLHLLYGITLLNYSYASVSRLLAKLPRANLMLLTWVMRICKRLVANGDVTRWRTNHDMAIVIATALFQNNLYSEPAQHEIVHEDFETMPKVIAFMLDNFEKLFGEEDVRALLAEGDDERCGTNDVNESSKNEGEKDSAGHMSPPGFAHSSPSGVMSPPGFADNSPTRYDTIDTARKPGDGSSLVESADQRIGAVKQDEDVSPLSSDERVVYGCSYRAVGDMIVFKPLANTRTPSHKNTKAHGYKNTQAHGYENTYTPRPENTYSPSYENSHHSRYENFHAPRYENTYTPRYENTRRSRYENSQTSSSMHGHTYQYENSHAPRYENSHAPRYENSHAPRYESTYNSGYQNFSSSRFSNVEGARNHVPIPCDMRYNYTDNDVQVLHMSAFITTVKSPSSAAAEAAAAAAAAAAASASASAAASAARFNHPLSRQRSYRVPAQPRCSTPIKSFH